MDREAEGIAEEVCMCPLFQCVITPFSPLTACTFTLKAYIHNVLGQNHLILHTNFTTPAPPPYVYNNYGTREVIMHAQ